MNKNKNKYDLWKIVAVVISCLGLFFGTNLYQQITGHSFFAPSQNLAQSTITPSYLQVLGADWYYSIDKDWNNKPNIIYCRQDLRLANPDAKSDLIVNYSSEIVYAGQNIPIDAQRASSVLYKVPNSQFSCIAASLLKSTPVPHPPAVDTLVPELAVSTSTLGPDVLDGDFITDMPVPQDVSICSANPQEYFDWFFLESSPASMPLQIKNELLFDFHVLTTFYLMPDRYQYAPSGDGGYSPVKIRNTITSISGNSIPLPEYTCFFYR